MTKELANMVMSLYKDDLEFANKLINLDPTAIVKIAKDNRPFPPEEIVRAYENNEIEALYHNAKIRLTKQKVYFELLDLYSRAVSDTKTK